MKERSIYTLAFVEGAVVMTIELLSGQILAPLYGANLIAWTTVIGFVISFLALGYFIGGLTLNKKFKASWIIIAVFSLTAVYTLLLLSLGNKTVTSFYNADHFYSSLFFSCLFLIGIPCLFLGFLPPVLIHEQAQLKGSSGSAAGTIFFFSTMGSILSAFISGFYLIPSHGIIFSLKVVFTILLFASLLLMFPKKRTIALVFSIIIAVFTFAGKEEQKLKKFSAIRVLEKKEGINGQLLVVDAPTDKSHLHAGVSRFMFINRMGQTWVDHRTSDPMWSYVDYIVYLCGTKPHGAKVLLLGLGGGTVANRLVYFLNSKVDAVEFDPRIAEAAKTHFHLDKRVNVVIDDARHFINTAEKNSYDFVVFDVFKGEVPPSHVITQQALLKVNDLLKKDGAVVINYSGFISGEAGSSTRSVIKTVENSGFTCDVLPTPEPETARNCILVGQKEKFDLDKSSITLAAYGKPVVFSDAKIPRASINTNSDYILSDDKPVLELISLRAGLQWRKDYYTNFTRHYFENGIDLFY